MSRYALLKSPSMDDKFLTHARFVEPEDAEFICKLRSNQQLNEYISASDPDVDPQRKWIEKYKEREAVGEEFYFVIQHQMKDYGVVRLYDFKGDSFSWGSWIILPSRPSGLVTYSAVMVYEMGFEALGFEQAHFDVRIGNNKVIDFHVRSGAQSTDRSAIDQYFVFPKANWPAFQEKSAKQIEMHRVLHG
jgi:hypothetical protein|tara:strand:- start:2747 stop:3316 length:570 start_codon:yes stop_codon:yes gene_type:complete